MTKAQEQAIERRRRYLVRRALALARESVVARALRLERRRRLRGEYEEAIAQEEMGVEPVAEAGAGVGGEQAAYYEWLMGGGVQGGAQAGDGAGDEDEGGGDNYEFTFTSVQNVERTMAMRRAFALRVAALQRNMRNRLTGGDARSAASTVLGLGLRDMTTVATRQEANAVIATGVFFRNLVGRPQQRPTQFGATYFQRLRAVITNYRRQIGWGRRATVQRRGNVEGADLLTRMGAYDLEERMRLMRTGRLNAAQRIPVQEYSAHGVIRDDVEDIRTLAGAIVDAVFRESGGGRDPRSLVNISIPALAIVGPNMAPMMGNATTLSMSWNMGRAAMARRLEQAMDEALQSGGDLDWYLIHAQGLRIVVQLMDFPAVNGWTPRIEAEDMLVRGTVRHIPEGAYLDERICIPIAILTAACRELLPTGEVEHHEFVEFIFHKGEEDERKCVIFDNRRLSALTYYLGREKELQDMALELMEEAMVARDELDIDSCANFADALGIQIHVIYKESMCKRLLRYGDKSRPRSVTIMVEQEHAFPVMRPWRLRGNGLPKHWCDECHTCTPKNWTEPQSCTHRMQCNSMAEHVEEEERKSAEKYHGKEYVGKRCGTLWHRKENRALTGPFCFTCCKFCVTEKEAQKLGGGEEDAGAVGMGGFEECVAAGHRVMDDVGLGKCFCCDELLPISWPEVADKPVETLRYVSEHRCFLSSPQLKIGDPKKYYVWDIETVAEHDCHVPIYIYARSLYDPSKNFEFESIDAFCRHVMAEEFKGTTWIAHNSGGFDSNFVHAWLEDRGIMHTRIPSPMSLHRSLETLVDHFEIRFIDSFCFIPMGLAKIGPAFNLPVHKGDFPHKFSTLDNMGYCGPMPACDSPEDWYSMSTMRASSAEKAEVSVAKFKAWHAEEAAKYMPHTETPWVYMDELKRYCKLDCDVLAGALQCLRDSFVNVEDEGVTGTGLNAFKLCPVDPLAYLTMAQVCQQLYVAGLYASGSGFRIAHIPLPDRKQTPAKLRWLQRQEVALGRVMWRASTHLREWVAGDGLPVDGFMETLSGERHVFEYYDCIEKGCGRCCEASNHNAAYGCPNRQVFAQTQARLRLLSSMGYRTHVRWSHEDRDDPVDLAETPELDCMAAQRQANDGGFYGGRVEVFKPLWRCREGEKINYIDVVSLYPWVCATQRMCTGHPVVIPGPSVDRTRMTDVERADRYFGFAHVKVRGNGHDYFGGVPRKDRESGRLVFDNTEYRVVCFIDELRERLAHGAELLEVYEVWDWSSPGESVEGPMAGYVATFLRSKMECSGWKALCGREPESEAEKVEICNHLEQENLGLCRPRPDKVQDNPGGRQLAKLRLNMLWGKFVQTPQAQTVKFISGYCDYVKLWFDNKVDKSTLQFRRIRDGMDFMEVRYGHTSSNKAPSNTHYYLGGSCTAQARLKLTSMLRRVGKDRALYCDTDSVVYVEKPEDEPIETGEALGQWSSELDADVCGEEFMALAPKCYLLQYNETGRVKERESGIIKAKGVTLTRENLREIHADNMRKIIMTEVFGDVSGEDKAFTVQAQTFNIRMDHYGDRSMMNMYGEKVVRCVYSKRNIVVPEGTDVHNVHYVDTVPFH